MFAAMITAVSNLFAKLFEFKSKQIENKPTLEVIEDKRDYKKATNIAEKIIDIAQVYKPDMTFSDRLKFSHLVESFKKYN